MSATTPPPPNTTTTTTTTTDAHTCKQTRRGIWGEGDGVHWGGVTLRVLFQLEGVRWGLEGF